LNKINKNKEIKIKDLPIFPEGDNNVLNSLCKVKKIKFQKIEIREGKIQNNRGINSSPIDDLIQLIERLKIEVEGSKTENKLVIIFS